MAPWTNKTGLAKAAAILATVLGISIGLCGLNALAASGPSGNLDTFLFVTGFIELAAIAVSLVGLLLVGLFAVLTVVVNAFGGGEKEN